MLIRHTAPTKGQRHPPAEVLPHPEVSRCRSAFPICISGKVLGQTTGRMDSARRVFTPSLKQKVPVDIPGAA